MKVNIVPIGNSKGIRIPKPLLEQCNLSDSVYLEVKNGALIIRPARKPREGWDKALKNALAAHGPSESLWPEDMQDNFLKDEPEWPRAQ